MNWLEYRAELEQAARDMDAKGEWQLALRYRITARDAGIAAAEAEWATKWEWWKGVLGG